jgi:hypothetical protein
MMQDEPFIHLCLSSGQMAYLHNVRGMRSTILSAQAFESFQEE